MLRLLERCDAFRRPDSFLAMLAACECDATGRLGFENRPYPPRERLSRALKIAQGVDARAASAAAIERGLTGPAIAEAVRQTRVEAVRHALFPSPA